MASLGVTMNYCMPQVIAWVAMNMYFHVEWQVFFAGFKSESTLLPSVHFITYVPVKWIIIGSGDGLSPARHQTISSSTAWPVIPREYNFQLRNMHLKCRLYYDGQFAPDPMRYMHVLYLFDVFYARAKHSFGHGIRTMWSFHVDKSLKKVVNSEREKSLPCESKMQILE